MHFGGLKRILQCGHRSGADAARRVFMTARRMAGSVGSGGPCLLVFFPLGLVQALMLQEGIGDHYHQRVSMQTLP